MKMKYIFGIIGILAMLLVAGCAQQIKQIDSPATAQEETTNKVVTNVKLSTTGNLVDENGMTLYYFTKDYKGKSECVNECETKWPVFHVESPVISTELESSKFGEIIREDGSKQTTYNGWPLYYFFKDEKAGDVNGEGINNVWFTAKPKYQIMIATDATLGNFLVDQEGKTLYYFTKDSEKVSKCEGECLDKWPVFYAENIIVPSTLNKEDFESITNIEGSKQTTYKGKPLYYFFNDMKKGDTNGQSVKEAWFVIEP